MVYVWSEFLLKVIMIQHRFCKRLPRFRGCFMAGTGDLVHVYWALGFTCVLDQQTNQFHLVPGIYPTK